MKKLLLSALAMTIFILSSCEREEPCQEVHNVRHLCPTCWTVSYGDQEDVPVNQATFNYYNAQLNSADGDVCWEGMKE